MFRARKSNDRDSVEIGPLNKFTGWLSMKSIPLLIIMLSSAIYVPLCLLSRRHFRYSYFYPCDLK